MGSFRIAKYEDNQWHYGPSRNIQKMERLKIKRPSQQNDEI